MIEQNNNLSLRRSANGATKLRSRLVSHTSYVWALSLTTTAATALMYGRTMQPTLGGTWDSEELQHAAYSLSLAHSTGYPLFLLLGKVWTILFPFGNIAFRMNWFSAVWALGTVGLTFFILLHLTDNRRASVLGALILATATPFWNQAGMAQVGTFTTFLTSGLIMSLLLWRQGRVRLEICALIFGLALAHHRSTLFYAPGIFLFVLFSQPGTLHSGRLIMRSLGFMLLPFVVYLYVPLRAWTAPWMVYDLPSFVAYVMGTDITHYVDETLDLTSRASSVINLYRDSFSLLGIAFALFGLWTWMCPRLPMADNWAVRALLGVILALITVFTIFFGEIDRYMLVPVVIVAIAFGIGAARLMQIIDNLGRRSRFSSVANAVLFVALLGLVLRAVLVSIPIVDHSQNFKAYKFWTVVLALPFEPDAIVIGNWLEINQIRYMQRVEGLRPDIQTLEGTYPPQVVTHLEQEVPTGKTVYLTPGVKVPNEGYKYSLFWTLLRVTSGP